MKLKDIILESNDQTIDLVVYLDNKIGELKHHSLQNELLEYLREYWNKRIIPWHNDHIVGKQMDPLDEEQFRDELLDWINRINNELKY